jgi:hypothetical protein
MGYSDPLDERARAARRKHYENNKEQYRERNKQARKRAQEHVLAFLLTKTCVDCGESDVRCLEFDHRDRADKSQAISKMLRNGASIVKIDAEIAKCDVRCANCHRKVTAEQFGWYKLYTS